VRLHLNSSYLTFLYLFFAYPPLELKTRKILLHMQKSVENSPWKQKSNNSINLLFAATPRFRFHFRFRCHLFHVSCFMFLAKSRVISQQQTFATLAMNIFSSSRSSKLLCDDTLPAAVQLRVPPTRTRPPESRMSWITWIRCLIELRASCNKQGQMANGEWRMAFELTAEHWNSNCM